MVKKLRRDVSIVETKTNSLAFQTDKGSKRPSRKVLICWQLFLDLTYVYMDIFLSDIIKHKSPWSYQ